ncbi:MAG TPA: hypothetical protein VIL36_00255 [Acidimicrobiales bacterium]
MTGDSAGTDAVATATAPTTGAEVAPAGVAGEVPGTTATPGVAGAAGGGDARDDGPTRWVLASFSAGAGLLHLVMAPSHLGTSAAEGAGFLVAAWLQLALAVALVVRPTRPVLVATVVVNAGLVAAWAVSRTAGLPFGAHADHPESVTLVDGTCVAFELLLVALVVLRLGRPAAVRVRRGLVGAVVPVAVFAVASAAIASPAARDHSSHAHGGHGAEDEAHDDGAPAGGHGAHDPADAAAPGDPAAFASPFAGHDHDETPPPVELDPATQAALTAQLLPLADLVAEYPTLGVAEAKGAHRTGPFLPGQGSHVMPPGYTVDTDGVIDPEDVRSPLLIFDGTDPDAPLAGFMFYSMSEEEPEGFVGPNDHWHQHSHVCTVMREDGSIDTPFGAEDARVTEEMCRGVGGELLPVTGWMVHVWAVPGYESADGLFSDFNTKVTCPDGTYEQVEWFEVGDRDTFCRDPG